MGYKFLKNHLFLILLLLIILVVAFSNFVSGQWLTGWDTLHPEFDFRLNLQRMIFGAWRSDQGLGAVAAHAHMSDLPRILVMLLLWFFVPLISLKYSYILLCLILGPIGIYFFIKELLAEDKIEQNSFILNSVSFLGSLVYLFNLGTVQHFYVVFEMFAVQFAAIGWLFMFALKYLKTKRLKFLGIFFLISFLATPMAYASLLWFAYFAGFGLFLISYLFKSKNKKSVLLSSFKLVIVTLLANLFWLLPNLYLLFSGVSNIPKNSHINALFSEEAFLHNQAYGSLKNVAILKNFLFNWNNYDFKSQEFIKLLNVWADHLNQPGVLLIGYFVSAMVILGIVLALYKRKKNVLLILPSFLLAIVMIINANGIMETPFLWLRENSNLFYESLRFPFTKFSILLMMSASVLVSYVLFELLLLLKKRHIFYSFAVVIVFSFSLFWYSYPMFTGNLIGDLMTNTIPRDYFNFYTWAKKKPKNDRMAVLPIQSYAGWEYHDWGYEGPGFNWFALEQPLLVRDFDRWNPNNETFYNQLSTAFYDNDKQAFQNILEKYDVSYIILDESTISSKQDTDALNFAHTKEFLENINANLVFNSDFISVYDISSQSRKTAVFADYDVTYSRLDPLYSNYKSYISSTDDQINDNSIIFPFVNFGQTNLKNLEYLEDDSGFTKISYSNNFGEDIETNLVLPEFENGKSYSLPVIIEKNADQLNLSVLFPYQLYANGKPLIDSLVLEKIIPIESEYKEISIVIDDSIFNFDDENLKANGMINIIYADENEVVVYGLNSSLDDQLVVPEIIVEPFSMGLEIKAALNKIVENNSNRMIAANDLTIEVLSIKNIIDIENSDSDSNCEIFKSGEVLKEVEGENIVYSAKNLGAICDSVLIDKLKTPFVVNVSGQGFAGRGSKVLVSNLSVAKPEIEEIIKDSKFIETYGILHNSLEKTDFYLSLETRSFGEKVSKNLFDSLNYYLFPLDLVSEISFNSEKNDFFVTNIVELEETKVIGNSFYSTLFNSKNEKEVIYLSESYDNGWQAFYLRNDVLEGSLKHKFAKIFPWFFGTKLEHLKYNGWANAWIIPQGENTIIIVYWPELLSIAGYGLLIFTMSIFAIVFLRNKSKLIE